ncbi:conserved predicted transcriptional regulator [Phenylobacterium zucineum HLK1]|uniref:Conserved predicted transcriptional regulator n=1 Tax=Phenylobacterium zucineum (strain HLK1) TaxID=450851 RepID=B4RAI8_PHEZH|nr:Rrf2 family transcriptional regulator [Phenylobacterium zucineum]ACG79586.1 conserved predicted transcriptional regulator [Phenylobacterium zucineum HLK1]
MRLTGYTDFALRVLMYIAVHPDRRPTIAEIAAGYGISKNHLMKVVFDLGRAGYIETVRGKNGGLRLARPAESIGVGELVRRTEGDMALAPCLGRADGCVITPACRLKGVLVEARTAFMDVLDRYTIADLARQPESLRALLGQPALAEA